MIPDLYCPGLNVFDKYSLSCLCVSGGDSEMNQRENVLYIAFMVLTG